MHYLNHSLPLNQNYKVINFKSLIIIILLFIFIFPLNHSVAQVKDSVKNIREPKIINFSLDINNYQRILNGEKDSSVFHSGLVTLGINDSVGEHNTENYEEMIIVLEGEGTLIINEKETFHLKFGTIGYCPPYIKHDVVNTGVSYLKYIYIAVKSK